MTYLRRYKPQIRAATSRRWPNRSTVPNLAAGTPSRSKHSVDTIQRGHAPKRNACTRSPAPITKAAVAPERWVRTRAQTRDVAAAQPLKRGKKANPVVTSTSATRAVPFVGDKAG